MTQPIAIGAQGFADVRERGAFLVDKSSFIRDWWASLDGVTLVCRPRRFGKTLNLSMVEAFFSTRFGGRGDLFQGLEVWEDKGLRAEQGTWPVIFLSFANVKPSTYGGLREAVSTVVGNAYQDLLPAADVVLDPLDAALAERILGGEATETDLVFSINQLCRILYRATGRRAIVLLDEYDTPIQEAWLNGYWDRASELVRGFFNATFKTNPYLERALLTGITRVAHESIFSDLNNLNVVTTSSDEYATCFGFTQEEVDAALEEYGLASSRNDVWEWYDGFTFGRATDIYNPWSITNYLDKGRLAAYWANSSGNSLVSSLVSTADADFKADFEVLLQGDTVTEVVSDQIAFPDLAYDPTTVWALLVASGYLRMVPVGKPGEGLSELAVTNHETMLAFDGMVRRWFAPARVPYNRFVRALLAQDLDAMNAYLSDVALDTFSTFDTGRRPSGAEPERFYHGFVLGLLVDLRNRFRVRSNRESGFGRYDVMLEPVDPRRDDGYVLEFKVFDPRREASLEDTVASALEQIEQKDYAAELVALGLPEGRIHRFGLAFEGKRVLIG